MAFDDDQSQSSTATATAPTAPGPPVGNIPTVFGHDASELAANDPEAFQALQAHEQSLNQSTPTYLPQTGPQGRQQNLSMPSPQDMPTFSAGGTAITPQMYPLIGMDPKQVQTELNDRIQRLTNALDPKNDDNVQLQKQLNRLNYSPEQRAQDMYDHMFGIQRNQATGQVVHRNWLQTIAGSIGEMSLGFNQRENYVPLKERLMKQATAEYTAEAGPAARELLYQTQERRSLQHEITGLMGIQARNQQADRSAAIRQAQADVAVAAEKTRDFTAQSQAQLRVQQGTELQKKGDLDGALTAFNEARTILTQAQTAETQQKTKNIEATAGLGGIAGGTAYSVNLRDQAKQARANGDTATATALEQKAANYDALFGRNLYQAKPPTIGTVTIGDQTFNRNNRTGQITPIQPPGQGQGQPPTPQPGQTGPANTVNGVPVPPNTVPAVTRTWRSPQEAGLSNNAWAIPNNFPDTPAGRTPQNDALFSYQPYALNAGERKRITDSLSLWQNGREFNRVLSTINPAVFGTTSGNLNKFLVGQVTPGQLTTPGSKDYDSLMKLKALTNAIAFGHLGTQGSRSAIMAQDLAKEIGSWGSTPQAISSYLSGLVGNSANVLRSLPSSKAIAAPVIHNYRDMEEIYEPDTFGKDTAAARAEYTRRKGKK